MEITAQVPGRTSETRRMNLITVAAILIYFRNSNNCCASCCVYFWTLSLKLINEFCNVTLCLPRYGDILHVAFVSIATRSFFLFCLSGDRFAFVWRFFLYVLYILLYQQHSNCHYARNKKKKKNIMLWSKA